MSSPESTTDNPASRDLPEPVRAALIAVVAAAALAGEQGGCGPDAAPALTAALGRLCDELRPRLLPNEMTPAIAEVLRLPNFRCSAIAATYRRAGHVIEQRSEEEQAFVLFRFLGLALRHGPGWFAEACVDMDETRAKANAKRASGARD